MRTDADLERLICGADRRGYPAYKRLRGRYRFKWFDLDIAHVQGDPFASPSRLEAWVPYPETGLEASLAGVPHRRVAVEDVIARRLARELARVSHRVSGSGKSGFLGTDHPGPEVLARSACEIAADGVLVRFEAGFPARGRTCDARGLGEMLLDLVPAALDAVFDKGALPTAARAAAGLAEDRHAVRRELSRRGLVSFIADGSVLARASGASAAPLEGAKPFRSPDSLAVELDLPNAGRVRGMGVPCGVTLIVGGGYHGKSTLLRAMQEGVYDHVQGDGRELAITRADAVKVRAEDRRPVHGVDISAFIGALPDGRDTRRFSTGDASGSTSQAASTVEAVSSGCRALLIDEDTSATNFMVRDGLMASVVPAALEPIAPFSGRVRRLWERDGVSSVIVVGSSGAFFPAADTVIQMRDYEAFDITDRVRALCLERGLGAPRDEHGLEDGRGLREGRSSREDSAPLAAQAEPCVSLPDPGRLKARSRRTDEVSVGEGSADMRLVEQLVDPGQAAAIAELVASAFGHGMLRGTGGAGAIADRLLSELDEGGWAAFAPDGDPSCALVRPRREELAACLRRWRG